MLEKRLLRRVLNVSGEISFWVFEHSEDVPALFDKVERHILEINDDRVGVAEISSGLKETEPPK